MRILPRITPTSQDDRINQIEQDLIRREAEIGGKLFGPLEKGHTRQFFCLDKHTWVWHEAWSDKSGNHSVMTRYELRPNGVFKVQNGGSYQSLTDSEAKNLLRSVDLYAEKIVTGYQASLQPA